MWYWLYIILAFLGIAVFLNFLNWLSYTFLKNQIVTSRKWHLNICCGKTDGGGINADIVRHENLPHFILVKDIYHLPFKDKQFDYVLCSHTIEHIDCPQAFFRELQRVGRHITLVTPPLWDLIAVFNFLVHKWIVISFRKTHTKLPLMIPYPLGFLFDKIFDQIIAA